MGAPIRASGPITDSGGVTFRWRGAASRVVIVGTWCDWDEGRGLALAAEGDAWSGHLVLPPDAYIEYALLVDGTRVRDEGNRRRIANGVGGWNEQLWMPEATHRVERLRRLHVDRGTLLRHDVRLGWWAATPRRRRVDLYVPAGGHDPRTLPLLVVLDGAEYLRRGRLDRTLDALIATGAMAPVAAAFVANAGASRGVEYAGSDFTLESIASEVVPAAVDRLGLGRQAVDGGGPGRAVILGSSMGGLMALHAAVRRPGLFGGAIVQSCAAFEWFELSTIDLVRLGPVPPVRIWHDAGDHEWLAPANDELATLLRDRGYDATYRRQPGGHDQTSWGESLVDALPAIFPPA